MPEPIVMCFSGGKDSCLALHALSHSSEFEVVGLLTTVTDEYGRISMHGVRRSLLALQADSLGYPLQEVSISPGAANAEYESQMGQAFDEIRATGISRIAFGDIFLEDLKEYRERLLERHELQCLFPIWLRDTGELIESFLSLGFRAVTSCVDPTKLDENWVGREIDRAFVDELPQGIDPCGENGEFHTFVYDGPIFSSPIPVTRGKVVTRDSFLFCDLLSDTETEPAETR